MERSSGRKIGMKISHTYVIHIITSSYQTKYRKAILISYNIWIIIQNK